MPDFAEALRGCLNELGDAVERRRLLFHPLLIEGLLGFARECPELKRWHESVALPSLFDPLGDPACRQDECGRHCAFTVVASSSSVVRGDRAVYRLVWPAAIFLQRLEHRAEFVCGGTAECYRWRDRHHFH